MKKTKVIIFDFDDTLYSNVDWTFWFEYCRNAVRGLLSDISDKDKIFVEKELEYKYFIDTNAIELLQKFGKSAKEWLEWRNTHPITNVEYAFSDAKTIAPKELELFAKNYTLYIVTNNTLKDLKQIASVLNINISLFKRIFTATAEHPSFSKKYRYLEVCKLENISPEELLVIGDSNKTDIEPALEIGAKARKVNDCSFKYEDFKNILN